MSWGGPIGAIIALAASLAGCGSLLGGGGWTAYSSGPAVIVHHAVAVARPPIPVTRSGRIGALQVGQSTPADVIGLLGPPDAENTDRVSGPAFSALGYGACKHGWASKNGTPTCTTVFYFPTHTGKLVLMWTRDRRYTFRGIHVGVPAASARAIFGRPPGQGCLTIWSFTGKTAFVVVGVAGLGAGHVGYLVVHAEPLTKSNSLGALDCIEG